MSFLEFTQNPDTKKKDSLNSAKKSTNEDNKTSKRRGREDDPIPDQTSIDKVVDYQQTLWDKIEEAQRQATIRDNENNELKKKLETAIKIGKEVDQNSQRLREINQIIEQEKKKIQNDIDELRLKYDETGKELTILRNELDTEKGLHLSSFDLLNISNVISNVVKKEVETKLTEILNQQGQFEKKLIDFQQENVDTIEILGSEILKLQEKTVTPQPEKESTSKSLQDQLDKMRKTLGNFQKSSSLPRVGVETIKENGSPISEEEDFDDGTPIETDGEEADDINEDDNDF
jgi:hypothetical protein